MQTARVIIVDRESLERRALRRALERDPRLQLVAEAGTVREALRQIAVHQPHVVVVADWLPGVRGLTLTAALRRQRPTIGVVLLVERLDVDASVAAVETDAAGLICRHMPEEEVGETVLAVAQDTNPVRARAMAEPRIMARLLAGVRAGYVDGLTVNRYDPAVSLRLLGELDEVVRGKTNQEISDEAGLSERTVKRHVSALMRALGVRDRMGILRESLLRGWVSIGPEPAPYVPPWIPPEQQGAVEIWRARRALFDLTAAHSLATPRRA